MDVFIGRHAKVHGTDHKQNGPGWQLFWDLSSYDFANPETILAHRSRAAKAGPLH
jgi:hypothetical protein